MEQFAFEKKTKSGTEKFLITIFVLDNRCEQHKYYINKNMTHLAEVSRPGRMYYTCFPFNLAQWSDTKEFVMTVIIKEHFNANIEPKSSTGYQQSPKTKKKIP
jgi:hypothetical protein